ncbi:serine/threonine-protein kinase [Rhizobium rhizogenes]|uniref:serine/threonine-protein kinase n=1 Tax=Rhizobium rhizogenes TaxID=359 RepID=UPI0015731F4B|nr:serine/threonine-protein kinase [Rhizobium rhizogenes]NTH23322.1 protein kinase [Rhizobium rhizogenes]NTH36344.1 protein kinase [Rhizobium rhizogenes]
MEFPAAQPQILNNRFMILDEAREGGMALIRKAFDPQGQRFVAIKRMKQTGDPLRQKTSFNREVEALRKLEYPNIVSFVAVDQEDDGQWYLAIEWVEQTLETYILQSGPMSWNKFYTSFGKPLLHAIDYAQRTFNLVHRDLNPQNVMVATGGIPKITDYGISKTVGRDSWLPADGLTFVGARTAGYSPKEVDDGVYSRSRDCFSFAAITVFCMSGRKIEGDNDLPIALQEVSFPDGIRAVIERCLSDDSKTRPFDAGVLKAEIEHVETLRANSFEYAFPCFLEMGASVLQGLSEELSFFEATGAEAFVLDELKTTHALAFQRRADGSVNENVIDIFTPSWRFRVRVAGRLKEVLEITNVREIDATLGSKLLQSGLRIPMSFSFMRPTDPEAAADFLREINERILSHEKRRLAEWQASQSERIFRAWKGYVRDRVRFEVNRAAILHFTSRTIDRDKVTFILDAAASADRLGEQRLIRVGGRHVFGVIVNVALDKVIFQVESGDTNLIPRRGELILNTVAAERALSHQGAAVDAIMYGRLVNPKLKEILLDPTSACSPTEIDNKYIASSRLKGEKLGVLKKALGTTDILAIEGPPGTSKTDVISEIAVGWLQMNPDHKILLSSQTHTALDEAIERIASLTEGGQPIIRIGREEDPRISEFSQTLLLDKKVEGWASAVRSAAEQNLTEWATERGIDRDLVRLGMSVERLVQILERRKEVDRLLQEAEAHVEDAEKLLEGQVPTDSVDRDLEESTVVLGDEIVLLRDNRKALRNQEKAVREELQNSPDMGSELAQLRDVGELREWQDLYLTGDETVIACQRRLHLLESWLLKVGRTGDFNAAVLNSAKIIAGTCVGIANVKGIEDVQYDLCIVDEASKATATEILIPMSKSRRWIIVGDPEQLPPFFEEFGEELTNEFHEDDEIRPTILDRMLDANIGLPQANRVRLKSQHRMIEPIGELVSHCFYGGKLESPIASHGLTLGPEIPAPVTWFTTSGQRRNDEHSYGKTFDNPLEAEWIKTALDRIQSAASREVRTLNIAVISGYAQQVKRLTMMTNRNASDWPNLVIVCNSVDAFQGKQADVCIYSVVRSNRRKRLGFLKEKPRLNVALSRARSALIIVGDHLFCRTAKGANPFRPVLDWVEGHPATCYLGPLQ